MALPWKIYKNDPCWVAPLKRDIQIKMNPEKHPFYLHGSARFFLAMENEEPLGRIMVADDPRFNEENGTNQGAFGFFESVDRQEVANALLDQAAQCLREKGRSRLLGPMEFSTNYECGTLIDGFNSIPSIMMPYNPPYYQTLLEGWGLQKNRDLYAWNFDLFDNKSNLWRGLLARISRRHQVTIRHFDSRNFDKEVHKCLEVYDQMRRNWWWSCVSLTNAEIHYLASMLRTIAIPELILIAEVEGKPAGFCLTLPNLNEATQPMKGSLSWFGIPGLGIPRLFWRLDRVKTARMAILCVLPEFQKQGVAERLILETLDVGRRLAHFRQAELGWTDEKNDKVNRLIKRIGAKQYKTYRVYEKELEIM